MIVKAPLQLGAPWEPIDPSMAAKFEDEYATEIGRGHPLYGVAVRAIGRRIDRDDVLFELLRHLCDYAVVHLTWSGREEPDPCWPSFELFLDDELVEKCIRPAQKEYEA
jgi:hypothetical protein